MEKHGFLIRKFEENKFVWGSFILAAAIMLSAYIFLGYYPIGSHTILRVDMYHQYGPFHEELRDRLVNGRSFLYSWEGGLGKDFISQFAYYTASPLSFLMVFFPQENMPEAMALFVLLKVAFSASFFAYYLKKKFGRDDITIVIFALMYASMAFITSYYWNVMWLDAVALFPLVALGIESLVKERKYKMYCISLTIVILVNFYIAFLVCVFASLYFLVYLFSEYSWKKDKGVILDRFIRFSVLSIIAGGISMILTIPTAVALSHTQASDSSFPSLNVYDNVYQLITNHFVGARPVVLARNEDLPNVYSGLLTVMLIPIYYLNKNIKFKEKALYSLLLLFMLLCSCVNTLDFLIHGLHFPSNLPHRFTFIYSFVLIGMAYKAFINIKAIRKINYYYTFLCVFVGIIIITEFLIEPLNKDVERVLADYDFVIIAVLGAFYLTLILQIFNGKKKDIRPLAGLALIVFAECVFSTATGIAYTGKTNRESYVKYIDGVERAIDYLSEKDGKDFNRMEMHRFLTINEGSLYHFKGYSQFSSLAYGNTSKLMEKLGIAATSNSYRLYDPTPLIDSMFNIKYIVKRANTITDLYYGKEPIPFFMGTDEEAETLEKIKEYLKEKTGNDDLGQISEFQGEEKNEVDEKIKEIAGVEKISDIAGINPDKEDDFIYVYENPYALPLGFVVNGNSKAATLESIKNKYTSQLNEIDSDNKAIFKWVNDFIKEIVEHIELKSAGTFGIENWITDDDNPFDVQNDFIFSSTNINERILKDLPVTNIKVNNVSENGKSVDLIKLRYRDEEDKLVTTDAKEYLKEFGARNINEYELTRPGVFSNDYKPVITFNVDVNKTGRTFLYIDSGNAKKGEYSITTPNGETQTPPSRELSTGRSLIDVGYVDEGSEITVNLELTKKGEYEKTYRKSGTIKVYAANFSEENFERAYEELSKTPMVISEYGDDFINAKVETDKDGFLFTSIPYDDGWTVTLDGAEAEKVAFGGDGLLGVYMPKGSHDISFNYYPIGFNEGILITLVSIALLCGYGFFDKRERKKETVKKEV